MNNQNKKAEIRYKDASGFYWIFKVIFEHESPPQESGDYETLWRVDIYRSEVGFKNDVEYFDAYYITTQFDETPSKKDIIEGAFAYFNSIMLGAAMSGSVSGNIELY